MSDTTDGPPPCQHHGCTKPVTHSTSGWPTPGHLQVDYYCAEHAPPGADPIEIFCRECGEECRVNDDGTSNHVFDALHENAEEVDHDRDADHVAVPDNQETL